MDTVLFIADGTLLMLCQVNFDPQIMNRSSLINAVNIGLPDPPCYDKSEIQNQESFTNIQL